MFILISGRSGSGKTSVTEKLRHVLGRRGIAVWPYDVKRPLKEMRDVLNIVSSQYRMPDPPKGIELNLCPDWITPEVLLSAAKYKIFDITSSWEEKKLFYAVILDGTFGRVFGDAFPQSFKVKLLASDDAIAERIGSVPVDTEFESESEGLHTIVIDTNDKTIDEVAEEISTAFRGKMEEAFGNSPKKNDDTVPLSSSKVKPPKVKKPPQPGKPNCKGANVT